MMYTPDELRSVLLEAYGSHPEYLNTFWEAIVNLMDDDIREEIHAEGIEDEQEFLDAYCDRHMEKYGEEFQI